MLGGVQGEGDCVRPPCSYFYFAIVRSVMAQNGCNNNICTFVIHTFFLFFHVSIYLEATEGRAGGSHRERSDIWEELWRRGTCNYQGLLGQQDRMKSPGLHF